EVKNVKKIDNITIDGIKSIINTNNAYTHNPSGAPSIASISAIGGFIGLLNGYKPIIENISIKNLGAISNLNNKFLAHNSGVIAVSSNYTSGFIGEVRDKIVSFDLSNVFMFLDENFKL
ncbi:hypothetical protein, partial [Campylobacter peloridis]|uniref:hypothetical protein n=1 Tax=Campylobacter peloridis TaxID=488546 RepID=UPI001C734148